MTQIRVKTLKWGVGGIFLVFKEFFLEGFWPPPHKISVYTPLNVWDSNHADCQNFGIQIFKHLLAEKSLNCFLELLWSDSPCMVELKNYFRYSSAFSTDLNQLFKSAYDINNIHANDLDAIKLRISYVERNEPRSTYCFRQFCCTIIFYMFIYIILLWALFVKS